MKLLANENFPRASVTYLTMKGYDITAVGGATHGITDKAVMDLAMKENRIILTFDRDYGELIFRHGFKPAEGVIFLREIPQNPREPGERVERLLTKEGLEFSQRLTVVDAQGIRQRKY